MDAWPVPHWGWAESAPFVTGRDPKGSLLPVHPQFHARVAARSLGVQLGKRTLFRAPDEGVPIVVCGLPCWVIRVLWLRMWYNTMLSSQETAIE